jgi:hypothetical protein
MAFPVHVRIEDVRHPDGGHALIVFTGSGMAAADGLIIRRFDRVENNLSHEGWRGPESRLQPLSVDASGNELRILVGPDVTEWIEFGERVELALPGGNVRALASWPEIGAFTGGDVRRWRRLMSGQRAVHTQPRAPLPPEPAPTPPPLPVMPPAAPFSPAEPATMIGPRPIPPPLPAAPPAAKGRNSAFISGVVIVALLGAAGGAGYWYYDNYVREQTPPQSPPPPPPPIAQSPPPPPVAQPQSPPPPPVAQADPTNQAELGARVAGLSPQQSFELAERLWRQRSFDLALLAFEDSAGRGHGPAHAAIARMYDPATHQPNQPFQRPNPRKAVEHYAKALEAGHNDARAPLQALVANLRQQAGGSGGPAQEAERILREFQQPLSRLGLSQ